MSTCRSGVALILLASLVALPTTAGAAESSALLPATARDPWKISWQTDPPASLAGRAWQIEWPTSGTVELGVPLQSAADEDQQPAGTRPRPKAFEYSDAYNTRRKIHMYASFATLPLFVTEWVVGQKLYNGTGGDAAKTTHQVVAASIITLFAVNTVTGVWNLMEARNDPNHHTKRMIHGILMLVADAGFVATAAMAPKSGHYGENYTSNLNSHRTMAIVSVSVATTGYLMMLFGR